MAKTTDQTFQDVLETPDGDEIELLIEYNIMPPDRRAGITWHWPEVERVHVVEDDGDTIRDMPSDLFDAMEDAIYKATEQHMENLPSKRDVI